MDAVSVTAVGIGLPVLITVIVGDVISVAGVWLADTAGYVCTVPVTLTRFPITAVAGRGVPV
jgi:hypothetical protein